MDPISYTPSRNGRCIIGFPTSFTWGYPIDVHLKAAMGHLLSLSPNRADWHIKILDPPKVSWHLMFHTGRLEKQTNEQTNRQTKKTNIHTFNEQLTSEIKRLCPKLGGQKQHRWFSLLFDWGVRWRVFFHCMDCTYSFMMCIYIYIYRYMSTEKKKLYIYMCVWVCATIYI